MAGEALSFDTSLAEMEKADWLAALASLCEDDGYLERLGKRHVAAFIEAGTTLLVTFETLQGIHALSPKAQPLGWRMIQAEGWSHLCIASDGDTWFRDRAVFGYFDRLVDDGFFDEFETVIFYGAGPCGYAAAAYAVASPGARVVVVQPQATLDPRITEWDDRFSDMRRLDFTARYGYAPDMIDGAERAHVLYDPAQQLDAMHAALFTRPNVVKHRLRFMGDAIQTDLLEMDIFDALLKAAANDTLDEWLFSKLLRSRRNHSPYLRNLMTALDSQGRDSLVRALAQNVTARMKAPRFARRLAELNEAQDD
ncbi:phosphoadenosine phosphosulfate reductase [Sulfitobacter sp. SK012]|uniref:phosphoadenosine phosphosulfate reductase n=1 Tax=Sulfitobacter sp. SK012 TaxID=1389005 RepID=UPI000E0A81D4|nr:phosphoadenosine phosphosulfate reductase [Sulfitobacter sp. SK012]AXI46132.1 phosphoadenosine phosphosulfate reductase [Sulfitobacter sp. SK012]